MSLYDGLRDVALVIQKADNITLYKQLLDLSAQALDMQSEISRLREENSELKRKKVLAEKVVRHRQPFITLTSDEILIRYCACCWEKDNTLIQVKYNYLNGSAYGFECPICHTKGPLWDDDDKNRNE